MLQGKRVLIGISGGIAAFKIPYLVRELIKADAEVRCILTPSASEFVTPLTLATLSKNPVESELYNSETGVWTNHVDLALWADLLIVAPLTASTLSKMVSGHSDNLLLTTYLSSKCPVLIAPAMDLDMYSHPSTITNLKILSDRGVSILDSPHGDLASGLVGKGRMAEPKEIFIRAMEMLHGEKRLLQGKKVLITAGPTYEAIDPVRFIGNHSTGKMGISIAERCAILGAEVILILGESKENVLPLSSILIVHVTSAEQMLRATQNQWETCDIGIFSAAVADYRPKNQAAEKIKKSGDALNIELSLNPDIVAWAGANKKKNQYLVGFALETENEIENAKSKLKRKNLNLIVLNSLRHIGSGFGHDTNQVTFIDDDNKITNFELLLKSKVAENIIDYVIKKLS